MKIGFKFPSNYDSFSKVDVIHALSDLCEISLGEARTITECGYYNVEVRCKDFEKVNALMDTLKRNGVGEFVISGYANIQEVNDEKHVPDVKSHLLDAARIALDNGDIQTARRILEIL